MLQRSLAAEVLQDGIAWDEIAFVYNDVKPLQIEMGLLLGSRL